MKKCYKKYIIDQNINKEICKCIKSEYSFEDKKV